VTPSNTTTSFTNPYQYTGREADTSVLYYYRARYYSPQLPGFISEDPLGFGGGQPSFYGYAGGNPVMYTGRENDGDGLFYYRARYYSPIMGRFISEDPIRFGGR
jgi:RHS repeat-associated protein